MNLTLKEKRIIYQILILIMKADLVNRQEELTFLDKIFHEFNLSIDEFDHMDNIDIDYLIEEMSSFPEECKRYAKKLFMQMAVCDGFVDPREMEIIEKIS